MNTNYRSLSKDDKNKVVSFVVKNYKNIPTKEIAEKFVVGINTIHRIARLNNLSRPNLQDFIINEIQNQILIGGILGDGNFKTNGKSSCYYRECHSVLEKDYLMWKNDQLKPMVTGNIVDIKARAQNQNNQVGFQTRNSPSFNKYKSMSIDNVIDNIDELGLLVWMLDDGWIHNSKIGFSMSYCVSGGSMTLEQKNKLKNRIYEVMAIEFNLVGKKSVDFRMYSRYNEKLLDYMLKYFDMSMDIMIKKFKTMHLKYKLGIRESPLL